MHPELLQSAEQGHKEQPSEVEKPHTPPKRETPLVPLQRYASVTLLYPAVTYPAAYSICAQSSCTQHSCAGSLMKVCGWLKV